jgi:hypothetical protein
MKFGLFTAMLFLWANLGYAGTLPEPPAKTRKTQSPSEMMGHSFHLQAQLAGNQSGIAFATEEIKAASFSSPSIADLREQIATHYKRLALNSSGQYYSGIGRPLESAVTEMLQDQLVSGADVVFVIDHTSSMEDDISEIREEFQTLMGQFQAKQGVRVGIVTFSDVKSGSKYGYRAQNLTADFASLIQFLDEVELMGSIEDMYGAIWKTVDEFDWKSTTKRMIVLIGDEKPATGKDTNFTEEEVLAKCARAGVDTNLYPILVDKYKPVGH